MKKYNKIIKNLLQKGFYFRGHLYFKNGICSFLFPFISVFFFSFSQSFAQSVSFEASPNSPHGVGANPRSVALGDLNGDGVLDMAVAVRFRSPITTERG